MATPSVHDRLVSSAVTLLRTHGADGFGMSTLLEDSGVARRSMYQHFPGGKAELLREATATAGKGLCAQLTYLLDRYPPMEAVDEWVAQWTQALTASDYSGGCPLAAASLSAPEYPDAAAEAATAFTRAARIIADALIRDGHDPETAQNSGDLIITGFEGAILVARATRSPAPLHTFVAHMKATLG